MKNQQKLIIKAIEAYDCYSDGQKKILSTLYKLSVDNTAIIKVSRLSEITGYSRYMVYKSLKQFEQDGILKMSDGGQKLSNTFRFNESKIQSIIDLYNKMLQIITSKNI